MNLRFTPAQRILILLISLCLFTVVCSLISAIVMRGGMTTQSLRVSTVVQDCFVFILPAVVTAVLISNLPARFLCIDRGVSIRQLLLAVVAMLVSVPAMNFLVRLNAELSLPESMSGVEQWMRASEDRAQEIVEIMLGGTGVASLIISILIVGVLAGLSEELFFRGALQNIFSSSRMNRHVAIWLTAFIFSAFHMQFYGFFPRLLLGAYFGYLLYWSRSLWLPVLIHIFNNSLVVCVHWRDKIGETQPEAVESFNDWGVDSPTLILASVILTAFVIMRLYKLAAAEEGVISVK